jgi:hypothetical protein
LEQAAKLARVVIHWEKKQMVRYAVVFWLLATMALAGCSIGLPFMRGTVRGSGGTTTRQYDLSGYSIVDVDNAFRVEITRSDTFSTSVTADNNMFDYIRVSKDGSHLHISLDPAYSYLLTPGSLTAKITLPTLEGVSLSGATRATVSGFKSTADIKIDLSGASQLDGDISAGNARFDTSGASRAKLQGSGTSAAINGSGASRLDLGDWPVESADVSLSGGSNAVVNASSKLDYDLSGGSHLTYTGNPAISGSNASGGSAATRQ